MVHHKTALQWAVERVASLGSVDLVRHLLHVSSTPARSPSSRSWTPRPGGTRYRADTVDRLLNVAYALPTQNDDLRRQLVQLLQTNNDCRRPSAAALMHW